MSFRMPIMLSSIKLNDQKGLRAEKINNVIPDYFLSGKTIAFQLLVSYL